MKTKTQKNILKEIPELKRKPELTMERELNERILNGQKQSSFNEGLKQGKAQEREQILKIIDEWDGEFYSKEDIDDLMNRIKGDEQ